MTFKNTSRYPDAEVRRLVEFALRNLDHRGVAVHVKNCGGTFAGRAYSEVPYQSPLIHRRKRRVRYLMTVRIGAPEKFPLTTAYEGRTKLGRFPLMEYRDWREALVGVTAHEGQHIKQFQLDMPVSEVECERVAKKRIAEYRRELARASEATA